MDKGFYFILNYSTHSSGILMILMKF